MKNYRYYLILLPLLLLGSFVKAEKIEYKKLAGANVDNKTIYGFTHDFIEGLAFARTGIGRTLILENKQYEIPGQRLVEYMAAFKQANNDYRMALFAFQRNANSSVKDVKETSIRASEVMNMLIANDNKAIAFYSKILSGKQHDGFFDKATDLQASNQAVWESLWYISGMATGNFIMCPKSGQGTCNRLALSTEQRTQLSKRLIEGWGENVKRLDPGDTVADTVAAAIYKVIASTGYQSIDGSYLPSARSSQETSPSVASKAEPDAMAEDVDRPIYKVTSHPNDFALVVGVEKYSVGLPDAQFAERDAQAVKNHLIALGYPERNIKFLTGSRASLSTLAAHLEDWLPRNVKPDSRVFFYFAGHGAPDPKSGQAYLVPFDGDPNFIEKTAYPLKKLYADLGMLKAKQVIVALDSCFSGSGGRSVLAEGTRPLVSTVDMVLSPGGKIVLFAAASPKEVTCTLKEQGHGLFTYFFLKGLNEAAKEKAEALTPHGLFDYLRPKVQDAASRQNRDQTPVLEGEAVVPGEIFRFK